MTPDEFVMAVRDFLDYNQPQNWFVRADLRALLDQVESSPEVSWAWKVWQTRSDLEDGGISEANFFGRLDALLAERPR